MENTSVFMVLKSCPIGIIAVDKSGNILFANPELDKIFGYSHNELLNQKVEILIPELMHENHVKYRNDYFANPIVKSMGYSRELFGVNKNGKEVPVEVGLCPFAAESGDLVIASIIDISERKNYENNLKKSNEELEQFAKSNEELEQFAYIASHDLKAPLRAITNLVNWIEEDLGVVSDNTKENFDLLKQRVYRMESLINGILEYSRIGRRDTEEINVDLNDILDQIKQDIDLRDIKLEIKQLPVIEINPVRIKQVFINLISNAIKYHNKFDGAGWVKVYVEDNKNNYRFAVEDNGMGIDKKYHEKIFQIFQTLQPKDDYDSTGIGLALVKKIVLGLNGKIWVESEEGYGSKFVFTIPKENNESKHTFS